MAAAVWLRLYTLVSASNLVSRASASARRSRKSPQLGSWRSMLCVDTSRSISSFSSCLQCHCQTRFCAFGSKGLLAQCVVKAPCRLSSPPCGTLFGPFLGHFLVHFWNIFWFIFGTLLVHFWNIFWFIFGTICGSFLISEFSIFIAPPVVLPMQHNRGAKRP